MSSFRLTPSLRKESGLDASVSGQSIDEADFSTKGRDPALITNNELTSVLARDDTGSAMTRVLSDTGSEEKLHEITATIADLKQEKASFFKKLVQSIPQEGLSRSEISAWHSENTVKAKRQLKELEQRIQRLQIVSRNLVGMASGIDKAEQISRELPELTPVQPFRSDFADPYRKRADSKSQNLMSTIRSPTELHRTSMHESGSDPEASPTRSNPQPILALEEIRQMLHEEMTKVISEQPDSGSPPDGRTWYAPGPALKGLPTSTSQNHEATGVETGPSKWKPDSDGVALSHFFREELLADADAGGRGGIRYEDVVYPRNLHEAEPHSLRLLCGGFSRQSPVRIKCFQVYLSPAWNTFFALVSVVNAALIGLSPESSGGVQEAVSNPYERATASLNSRVEDLVGFSAFQGFDYACVALLGLEVAAGCIAVGLVSVRSAWLRCSDLHKVELFVLLAAVGEFVGAYFGFRSFSLRPLLLVRVLKPILRFGSFVGMRVILAALHQEESEQQHREHVDTTFRSDLSIARTGAAGASDARIRHHVPAFLFQRLLHRREHCCSKPASYVGGQDIFPLLGLRVADWCAEVVWHRINNRMDMAGMTIMQNSFRRMCVVGETLIPSCASDASNDWNATCSFKRNDQLRSVLSSAPVVTGGYPFRTACKIFKNHTVESLDLVFDKIGSYYHDCKFGRCVEESDPVFGFVHFDHVGGALLALIQALGADRFEDVLSISLQSEPLAKPVVWVFWASVTVFCTIGMQNLLKAVVVVHIRFARSVHADQMFQIAGSANPPPIVTNDGAAELDDAHSLNLRPQSGHSSQRHSEPRKLSYNDKVGDKAFQNGDISTREAKFETDKNESREFQGQIQSEAILAGEELSDGRIQSAALLILNDWKVCRILDLAIVANTVAIAGDQWDSPYFVASMAYFVELACAFIFLCETVLRFAMSGDFKTYWSSSSNRFEMFLTLCAFGGFVISSAQFLLSFPTVRIYRVLLHFPTLKVLTHGCISSFRGIFTLSTVMITLGLAWAIMGRYLIGDKMNTLLRANFGSFSDSLLTIFKLFVGDVWSTVLYAAMSTRTSMLGQAFVASFILFWVFCSKFIFLSMYIAIVIEHFQSADLLAAIRQGDIVKYLLSLVSGSSVRKTIASNPSANTSNDVKEQIMNQYYFSNPSNHSHELSKGRNPKKHLPPTKKTADLMLLLSYSSTDHGPEEDMLYMLKPPPTSSNPIRNLCIMIVSSRYYQLSIVVIILASSLVLISTPPNKDLPASTRDWTLISYAEANLVSDIITILFTLEFILNAVVYGMVKNKGSVLRSAWGIADLVVLIFAWIELLNWFQDGVVAKIFRLIRVISPFFRFVKRFRTLREIFERVMSSSAPLLYVCVHCVITIGVFALIGMSLFGGKMYRCTSLDVKYPRGKIECSGFSLNINKGFLEPRSWVRPNHNFDTAYFAFLTLFRVATFDLQETMDDTADITGIDSNPLLNNNSVSAVFFVVYVIVAVFLVVNMCVLAYFVMSGIHTLTYFLRFSAYIIDSCSTYDGLTQAQIFYNRFSSQLTNHRLERKKFNPPNHYICVTLRTFLGNSYFKQFSSACVLINVCCMLFYHSDSGQNFDIFLSVQNAIFFGELCVEIILYLIAEGPGIFLEDGWRLFELLLALGSAYGYTQTAYIDGDLSSISVLFQSLRIYRLVPNMRRLGAKPLQLVLETLLSCLQQSPLLIIIIFLVYAVFALVGVELFGTTRYGHRLGPTANFDTWFSAIKTLFQIFVGDGNFRNYRSECNDLKITWVADWTEIMDDCSVQPPFCTPQFSKVYMYGYLGPFYSFGDCGLQYASIYFLAVKLICEFVLINLLIGIFLKNFHFLHDEMMQQEDEFWSHGASAQQIKELTETFQKFDQPLSPFTLSRLAGLKMSLPYPLGLDTRRKRRIFMFKHDKTGQAAWLLIRAELNVLVRGRRYLNKHIFQQLMYGLFWCLGLQFTEKAPEVLEFHETMMTVFRWRMPLMVPQNVKQGRVDLIPEIVLTAYALTIYDFLRQCVALRRRSEIKARPTFVVRVQKWCMRDTACCKRMELLHTMNWAKVRNPKQTVQSISKKHVSSHREFFNLSINPIDMAEYEDSFLSHQTAFDEYSLYNRTSSTGIQVFRSKLKQYAAVLKFVDPLNAHRGCFIADFTGFKWVGWTCLESTSDAIFQLTSRSFSSLRKIGMNAQRVECFIRFNDNETAIPVASLEQTLEDGSKKESFHSIKCNLIDIHAFQTADHKAEHGIRQVLRLYLGPKIETPSYLIFDGVMEVLGYVMLL